MKCSKQKGNKREKKTILNVRGVTEDTQNGGDTYGPKERDDLRPGPGTYYTNQGGNKLSLGIKLKF